MPQKLRECTQSAVASTYTNRINVDQALKKTNLGDIYYDITCIPPNSLRIIYYNIILCKQVRSTRNPNAFETDLWIDGFINPTQLAENYNNI
jgi:hypothetical protein